MVVGNEGGGDINIPSGATAWARSALKCPAKELGKIYLGRWIFEVKIGGCFGNLRRPEKNR